MTEWNRKAMLRKRSATGVEMRHSLKLILLASMLAGCAGSPAAISSMDSNEIRTVSDERLCNTYASTYGFVNRRTPVVINEVRRRNVDCSAWVEYAAQTYGRGTSSGPSLTEFGLRTMSAGSPQPGAVAGPSTLGAIGEAGVGTLGGGNYGPGDPTYDRLHPTTTIIRPYGDGWVGYTYSPSP